MSETTAEIAAPPAAAVEEKPGRRVWPLLAWGGVGAVLAVTGAVAGLGVTGALIAGGCVAGTGVAGAVLWRLPQLRKHFAGPRRAGRMRVTQSRTRRMSSGGRKGKLPGLGGGRGKGLLGGRAGKGLPGKGRAGSGKGLLGKARSGGKSLLGKGRSGAKGLLGKTAGKGRPLLGKGRGAVKGKTPGGGKGLFGKGRGGKPILGKGRGGGKSLLGKARSGGRSLLGKAGGRGKPLLGKSPGGGKGRSLLGKGRGGGLLGKGRRAGSGIGRTAGKGMRKILAGGRRRAARRTARRGKKPPLWGAAGTALLLPGSLAVLAAKRLRAAIRKRRSRPAAAATEDPRAPEKPQETRGPVTAPGRQPGLPLTPSATDHPSRRKHPVSNQLEAAAESIEQGIGGFEPENMADLGQFLQSLPAVYEALAGGLNRVADRFAEDLPLHPAVVEHIREMASSAAGLHEYAGEAHQLFLSTHEDDINRIENPRTGEEFMDVSNQ